MPRLKKIVILPGDGIGPEIMEQSIRLLRELEEPFGFKFEFQTHPIGVASIREKNTPLGADVLRQCRTADAVLLGPIGDRAWQKAHPEIDPNRGLDLLRTGLGAYCSVRSIIRRNVPPQELPARSTRSSNIDLVIIREMWDGHYSGDEFDAKQFAGSPRFVDDSPEKEKLMRRVIRKAFDLAMVRKRRISVLDEVSAFREPPLWRSAVEEIQRDFPEVGLELLPLDLCLEELTENPFKFDVILTDASISGDVCETAEKLVTDDGLLASACLCDTTSVYQPVHSPETQLTGKNLANPVAMMSSVALMLQYSFEYPLAAMTMSEAISTVVARGYCANAGEQPDAIELGTAAFSKRILDEMVHSLSVPPMTG